VLYKAVLTERYQHTTLLVSFFLLALVAVYMEGIKFTPSYLQSSISIMEDNFLAENMCHQHLKLKFNLL